MNFKCDDIDNLSDSDREYCREKQFRKEFYDNWFKQMEEQRKRWEHEQVHPVYVTPEESCYPHHL